MIARDFIIKITLAALILGILSACHRTSASYTIPTNGGEKKYSKSQVIRQLEKADILHIQYGDTITLVVPTDRYFLFNTPRLNDLCYEGLLNIIRLLRLYPQSQVYVAGFTDNIGSEYHKKILTQARAEAMITFLWAQGIGAKLLHAEGYGDKYPVSPNSIIHGSAYNRRLEIQWFINPQVQAKPLNLRTYIK